MRTSGHTILNKEKQGLAVYVTSTRITQSKEGNPTCKYMWVAYRTR